MTSHATLAAMVALMAVGAAGLGAAQDGYPSRTIRLVVGFSAGGPTDLPARLIAEKIGDALGRRLTVENKTGAGGMLATRDVLAQEADGHTLLLCTHFESINIAAYRNPGYKLDEIAPISLIAKYYYALALAPAVPASTFEEFVQYAKAHPGELNYATIGTGSAQEILARQIEGLTGIKLNKVPFRLSSQIITDMAGLGTPEKPHPLQTAYVQEQVTQCGYCANGWVMTAAVLLATKKKPSDAEIKQALEGLKCRCGTHMVFMRANAQREVANSRSFCEAG